MLRSGSLPRTEPMCQASGNYWTSERVEEAARLWRTGASAGTIAKALGGVSRNAVIGKIYRHPDLFEPRAGRREVVRVRERRPAVTLPTAPRRQIVHSSKPGAMKKAVPAVAAEPILKVPAREPGLYRHRDFRIEGATPVPHSSLDRFQCAWPLTDFADDDTKDMPCCGRPRRGGMQPDSSYCPEHAAISRGAA